MHGLFALDVSEIGLRLAVTVGTVASTVDSGAYLSLYDLPYDFTTRILWSLVRTFSYTYHSKWGGVIPPKMG
jgi:hypothetical protein